MVSRIKGFSSFLTKYNSGRSFDLPLFANLVSPVTGHRTDAGKQTTELAQRRMHMEPMHIPSIIMLVRSFFMVPSVLSSSILGMVALYPSHPLLSSLFRDFPDCSKIPEAFPPDFV